MSFKKKKQASSLQTGNFILTSESFLGFQSWEFNGFHSGFLLAAWINLRMSWFLAGPFVHRHQMTAARDNESINGPSFKQKKLKSQEKSRKEKNMLHYNCIFLFMASFLRF